MQRNNKKEKLLEILKNLFGFWDNAEAIYSVVFYTDNITDEVLNDILFSISTSLKNVKINGKIDILKKSIEKIKEIKDMEESDKNIKNLDKLFDNF